MVEHYIDNVEKEVHRFLKNGEANKAWAVFSGSVEHDMTLSLTMV